jgi:hypothetical protein
VRLSSHPPAAQDARKLLQGSQTQGDLNTINQIDQGAQRRDASRKFRNFRTRGTR